MSEATTILTQIQADQASASAAIAKAASEAAALSKLLGEPTPPPPPPATGALEWGINLPDNPPWAFWSSQHMHYMRLRYPLESREGTDNAPNEIAEGMRIAKTFNMHGIGTIDTGSPIPSGSSYAAYGVPILKNVAAQLRDFEIVEAFNEPDLKSPGGMANVAGYAAGVNGLYEGAMSAGLKLATASDPTGLYIPVYLRSYNGEWAKALAKALTPKVLAAVNSIGSHMYGSLSTTDAGGNGNHDLASLEAEFGYAASAGFSAFAREKWVLSEFGWALGGTNEHEGEVPDVATQAKRYGEVAPIFKRFGSERKLWIAAAYARGSEWRLTTTETGTTLTEAGKAFVAGAA